MWRRGILDSPVFSVLPSWSNWSIPSFVTGTADAIGPSTGWSIEAVGLAHLILAGLLWAASLWHWVYWDLDLFRDRRSTERVLDSPRLFGIHLTLASILCVTFGAFHVAVFPGIWCSDVFAIAGGVQ